MSTAKKTPRKNAKTPKKVLGPLPQSQISALIRPTGDVQVFGKAEHIIRQALQPFLDSHYQPDMAITRIFGTERASFLKESGALVEALQEFIELQGEEKHYKNIIRCQMSGQEKRLLKFLKKDIPKDKNEKRALILDALVTMAKAASLLDDRRAQQEPAVDQEPSFKASRPHEHQFIKFLLMSIVGLGFGTDWKLIKTVVQQKFLLQQYQVNVPANALKHDMAKSICSTLVKFLVGPGKMESFVDMAVGKAKATSIENPQLDPSHHDAAKKIWAEDNEYAASRALLLQSMDPHEAALEEARARDEEIEKTTGDKAHDPKEPPLESHLDTVSKETLLSPISVTAFPAKNANRASAASNANKSEEECEAKENCSKRKAIISDPFETLAPAKNANQAPKVSSANKSETECEANETCSKRKAIVSDPFEDYGAPAKKRKTILGSIPILEPAVSAEVQPVFVTVREGEESEGEEGEEHFVTARGGGESPNSYQHGEETPKASDDTAAREEDLNSANTISDIGEQGGTNTISDIGERGEISTNPSKVGAESTHAADIVPASSFGSASAAQGDAIFELASAVPLVVAVVENLLEANENNFTVPPDIISQIEKAMNSIKKACSSALPGGADPFFENHIPVAGSAVDTTGSVTVAPASATTSLPSAPQVSAAVDTTGSVAEAPVTATTAPPSAPGVSAGAAEVDNVDPTAKTVKAANTTVETGVQIPDGVSAKFSPAHDATFGPNVTETTNSFRKTVDTASALDIFPSPSLSSKSDGAKMSPVKSSMGILQEVVTEMAGNEYVTTDNNGYGSAAGGLTITNQGLMYSLYHHIMIGSYPQETKEYLLENMHFEDVYPEPTTDVQRGLAGIKYIWEHWCVVGKIGGGAFGTVYEVFLKSDPTVRMALKVCLFNAADFMKYGRREIVQGGVPTSRHKIAYTGFFPIPSISHGDAPIAMGLLMELCTCTVQNVIDELNPKMKDTKGKELRKTIYNDGLSRREYAEKLARVCMVALHLGCGIRDLHASGITHRDIKGANAGVGRDGYVKLYDLGLARQLAATKEMTVFAGTRTHLPPSGRGQKVDNYSWAVVFHELMVGKVPTTKEKGKTKKTNAQTVSNWFSFGTHLKDGEGSVAEALVDLFVGMFHPVDEHRMGAADAVSALNHIIGRMKTEDFLKE